MARKKQNDSNKVQIQHLRDEVYFIDSYLNGRRVRARGTASEMSDLKTQLEHDALAVRVAENDRHILPPSWLTPAQLRDAESAFNTLGNSKLTLDQCVSYALKSLGNGEPVRISQAFADYELSLIERGLSDRHRENVGQRLSAFFKVIDAVAAGDGSQASRKGPVMLGELDARHIERYCLRSGVAGYTKLGDAGVIRAFFSFCVERKLIASTPFAVKMDELKRTAERGRERPLILLPDQAQALLDAAMTQDGGNHVPYLLLTLWGGIRRAEVERLSANEIQWDSPTKATVQITPKIAKTGSYREVYLPANILPLLKECIDRGILDKTPIGPPLEAAWADIREKAGLIQVARNAPHYNRTITDTVWQENILRHTGLSYYFKKTGNVIEVARQAGHGADVSFKHYLTLAKAPDMEKFYAISATFEAPRSSDVRGARSSLPQDQGGAQGGLVRVKL